MQFFVMSLLAVLVCFPSMSMAAKSDAVKEGSIVSMEYSLTVDKQEIESTVGKNPLEFTVGAKQVLPALEKKIIGMRLGEEKIIKLTAKEGYGEFNEKAIKEFPKTQMPKDVALQPGMMLQASGPDGARFPSIVKEVKQDTVLMDFNHPLAGKELQFKVKVLGIRN